MFEDFDFIGMTSHGGILELGMEETSSGLGQFADKARGVLLELGPQFIGVFPTKTFSASCGRKNIVEYQTQVFLGLLPVGT